MRDTFDPDVAVVPNIGNHDVHPANHMLPPPPIPSPFSPHAPQSRPHFLHELLRVWSPILFSPPAWEHGDITTDFLNFGSFVKTVIPGENGLRVVSLNTLWYFPSNDGAGSCKFARNWGRETALLNLETSTGTSVWDLQRDPESGDWYVSLPASIQTQRRKKKLDIGSASLLWLHNVLLASRQAHHGIMIIGHIPPQGNYGPLWEDRCTDWFTRMVGEFMKDVVVGVWSGHTNEDNVAFVVRDGSKARRGAQTEPMDEMDNEREDETEDSSQVDEKRNEDEVEDSSEVDEKRKERFRDLDPTLSSRWRPLSLSPAAAPILLQPNTELAGAFFTSPSLVPARNPGFRIGELVWDQTWRLNGWTQYALDLKLANKLDRLEFGVEYETGVEYGIGGVGRTRGMVRQGVGFSPKAEQGITPEEWKVFIGRYSKNAKVRELYERFKDVEGELR